MPTFKVRLTSKLGMLTSLTNLLLTKLIIMSDIKTRNEEFLLVLLIIFCLIGLGVTIACAQPVGRPSLGVPVDIVDTIDTVEHYNSYEFSHWDYTTDDYADPYDSGITLNMYDYKLELESEGRIIEVFYLHENDEGVYVWKGDTYTWQIYTLLDPVERVMIKCIEYEQSYILYVR